MTSVGKVTVGSIPPGSQTVDKMRGRRQSWSRRRLLATSSVFLGGLGGCTNFRGSRLERDQDSFDPPHLAADETYPPEMATMFRGGTRRLGYYPEETVPESVAVNWAMPVNYIGHTAAKSSPLLTPAGDTIVIPSDTGSLYGMTPNGEQRWSRETGAARSLGFHGTPAIVDGVAYLGGYDGDVYAFDPETGDEIWHTSGSDLEDAAAIGSSPVYWDGVVYVLAEYVDPEAGTLWALEADSGEPLWSDDRLVGMPHPSTAIDPVHERIVTGSNDGLCYCWEFPSMEFLWSVETDRDVKGTIPTYDGAAFIGSWDGTFRRASLEDGTEEWIYDIGSMIMSNPGIDPERNRVYVGAHDHQVHALDAETGSVDWTTHVGGRVIGSLTVTPDAVLVGSYDSNLYALEPETGSVRWRVENRGHVTSEPVPRDGRIYYTERADIANTFSDGDEELQAPGHAYCLVDLE